MARTHTSYLAEVDDEEEVPVWNGDVGMETRRSAKQQSTGAVTGIITGVQ